MSGQQAPNARHRYVIEKIEVDAPRKVKNDICAWLLQDEKLVHKLPYIAKGQPLKWEGRWYCEADPSSTLTLQVYRKPYFGQKELKSTITLPMSEVSSESRLQSIKRTNNSYFALFTFVNDTLPTRVEVIHAAFMSIQEFGKVAAVHFPAIAETIFASCRMGLQALDERQEYTRDTERLVVGFTGILGDIQTTVPRAYLAGFASSLSTILELVQSVIEHINKYILITQGNRIAISVSRSEIDEHLQRLRQLKGELDRHLEEQALTEWIGEALSKLQTVKHLTHHGNRECLPGTRTEIIGAISEWVETTSENRLLWIYGRSGLGKSAVAISVCNWLERKRLLGASFICKWDDPMLREPRLVVQAIVHTLVGHSKEYAKLAASAIHEDPNLHMWSLRLLYERLVKHPLTELVTSKSVIEPTCVIFDALNECGTNDSCDQLFYYLHSMSQLAPWLKVVVTSRPNQSLRDFIDGVPDNSARAIDLAEYDASDDIYHYICERVASRPGGSHLSDDSLIPLLTRGAGGLFIWADVACRCILDWAGSPQRIEQGFNTPDADGALSPIDSLYALLIEDAMTSMSNDKLTAAKKWLVAIISISVRAPLAVGALRELLGPHLNSGVLDELVESLGPIFYTSPSKDHRGPLRIYHQSFADYLTTQSNPNESYTDSATQDALLAACCLRTMLTGLRFNICELDTSYMLNREVPEFESRMASAIQPHLAYSCQYWISHVTALEAASVDTSLLRVFILGRGLFYWIEVLSLLGKLDAAISMLPALVSWSCKVPALADVSELAQDTYKFILKFYGIISTSTPHLYVSAVAFAPANSRIAGHGRRLFSNTLRVLEGATHCPPRYQFSQSTAYSDSVTCRTLSPSGSTLISGSIDGNLDIWDVNWGVRLPQSPPIHIDVLWSVAFSPNDRLIASGSQDSLVRLWDTYTGNKLISLANHSGPVLSISFSPDSRRLVSGSHDRMVCIWNLGNGVEVYASLVGHSGPILCAVFSPDNRSVVSGSCDTTLRIWNLKTETSIQLRGHSHWVQVVAFSPDCKRVVSGSYDKTIQVWDVESGSRIITPIVGHPRPVHCLAFSRNGRHIASKSSDGMLRIWDVITGVEILTPLSSHSKSPQAAGPLRNCERITSCSFDHITRMRGAEIDTLESAPLVGHSSAVSSVAFSPDGQRIVSGSSDMTVRMWNAETGAPVSAPLVGHSDLVWSVAFSPDGRRIASASGDRTVRLWDAETGAPLYAPLVGHSSAVLAVAFSPEGQRIASGSGDRKVLIWDAKTGIPESASLVGHSETVMSVTFSPDGLRIASCSSDKTVRVWNAVTGAPASAPLVGHSNLVWSVAFSPNGQHLASGSSDKTVRLWYVERGTPVYAPLVGHSSAVLSVAFSPNGRHIASASGDKTVRLWDAETGAPTSAPLVGHSGPVNSISFSPDGQRIVSGSRDNTIRIWAVDQNSISSGFPVDSSRLASLMQPDGWVSLDDKPRLFWLPDEYRRPITNEQDNSLIRIRNGDPPSRITIDYSKFFHGTEWILVGAEPN